MGLAEIIGNYEPSTLWASSLEIVNIIWVETGRPLTVFHASSACEPTYRKPARMIRVLPQDEGVFLFPRMYPHGLTRLATYASPQARSDSA